MKTTKLRISFSACFVKIEVQLFSDRIVVFLDTNTDLADVALSPIVELAIIEDELHIIHEVLDALILVLPQLCFYC